MQIYLKKQQILLWVFIFLHSWPFSITYFIGYSTEMRGFSFFLESCPFFHAERFQISKCLLYENGNATLNGTKHPTLQIPRITPHHIIFIQVFSIWRTFYNLNNYFTAVPWLVLIENCWVIGSLFIWVFSALRELSIVHWFIVTFLTLNLILYWGFWFWSRLFKALLVILWDFKKLTGCF